MDGKNFKGGLDSLLQNTKEKPKTQRKIVVKTSQNGTKNGETRATFIVEEGLLDKIKAIAYWERVLVKDVIKKALSEFILDYEKNNGEVQSIPKKVNL